MTDTITARAEQIEKPLEQEARAKGGYYDRQRVANRYALERFLYRVGQSAYMDQFVLKGALLLVIYIPEANRPSRDADFQLRGVSTSDQLRGVLQDICKIEHNDGLRIDYQSIQIDPAGADRNYPGYTARIPVILGSLKCPIHLDFGFGEAITPPEIGQSPVQ